MPSLATVMSWRHPGTGLIYDLSDNPSKFMLQPLFSDRNDIFMYMPPVPAIGICSLSSPIFRVKSVNEDGSQGPSIGWQLQNGNDGTQVRCVQVRIANVKERNGSEQIP
ncbi:hypothetical protein AZE42_07342 [Rhizopogon vesiculosus]|uniref:Uncharacterized protein n=1 Tax=Rhizopogon vesiculosus TaxID=180088 RepID=A0A1J8PSY9_9AGAM|nr:hypothetical protein AZE42_07342 [Rhizopogon vesiculosus]